eukprot:scaffold15388_cov64-Attheya_sp.AAC.1
MQDPLVKWLSDAMPIIISNDNNFEDSNSEDAVDAKGICFRTLSDVKQKIWKSYANYLLDVNDIDGSRNGRSVFDIMKDHIDSHNWKGTMDHELDIDFRFHDQTDSFEIANTDGTDSILHKLITKALLRSKRDNEGNALDDHVVEYTMAIDVSEYSLSTYVLTYNSEILSFF